MQIPQAGVGYFRVTNCSVHTGLLETHFLLSRIMISVMTVKATPALVVFLNNLFPHFHDSGINNDLNENRHIVFSNNVYGT